MAGAGEPSGPLGPPRSSVSLGSESLESGPECRSNQYSTLLEEKKDVILTKTAEGGIHH